MYLSFYSNNLKNAPLCSEFPGLLLIYIVKISGLVGMKGEVNVDLFRNITRILLETEEMKKHFPTCTIEYIPVEFELSDPNRFRKSIMYGKLWIWIFMEFFSLWMKSEKETAIMYQSRGLKNELRFLAFR